MKKTKLLIFPLILSLFGTSSCANKEKIIIEQKENIDSFVYLTNSELSTMITNKEDFVLVVGENGCLTCETIKPVITDYIKKYEYIVYWVENRIYQSVVDKFVNSNQKLQANIMSATILLFDEGTTKEVINYDENLYFSEGKLELTLEDKVTGSNIYSLNTLEPFNYSKNTTMYKYNLEATSSLDEKIASNNDSLVLFSWAPCPDCVRIKDDVLYNYLTETNKKLYMFEVSHYRNDYTNNPELYDQFAKKYQFDSYRGGKVPTIVKYNNSSLVNMHVYFNDEFQKQEDGSYIIKNSFIPSLINTSYQNGSKMIEELKTIHKDETIKYLDSNL